MATEIRFHLDENVDHAVARGLRLRGIDATTARDAELLGADDLAHVAFALSEERVIVTHDPDFLALHLSGTMHAGIVFSQRGGQSVGGIVRALCLIHDCLVPTDMHRSVEYI